MSSRIKVNLFAFITVLLWGSGFPFTRLIGDQISSYSLCAIRCILAAVILVIIGRACHIRKPFHRKDLLWFFLSGMLGFSVYFIFFNLGLETLTSATASIVTAACPVLTAIAVFRLYGEKINLTGWICIACAFAGVAVLLLWNGVLSINIGILWMFLCAAVFAGYNVLNRKFSEMSYTAMEAVTYSAVFGGVQMLFLLPHAVSEMACADFTANMSAVYLGVMPSAVAYYFWSKAIVLAERTSEVTNYLFINPLIAAIIGFLMLREVPDIGTFIGGAVIIASVIIFTMKGNGDVRELKE